eukprot:Amastigsp_a186350_5.p2 type:complete len:272 gc:universal Amastigsp_a186350_5:1149-334(-)
MAAPNTRRTGACMSPWSACALLVAAWMQSAIVLQSLATSHPNAGVSHLAAASCGAALLALLGCGAGIAARVEPSSASTRTLIGFAVSFLGGAVSWLLFALRADESAGFSRAAAMIGIDIAALPVLLCLARMAVLRRGSWDSMAQLATAVLLLAWLVAFSTKFEALEGSAWAQFSLLFLAAAIYAATWSAFIAPEMSGSFGASFGPASTTAAGQDYLTVAEWNSVIMAAAVLCLVLGGSVCTALGRERSLLLGLALPWAMFSIIGGCYFAMG